jgi:phospholipid/cholesterol/gamma-HCH transport system substrate-binding protein
LKLSREIKTAILVIAAILLFIWGYSFLKGRDLFTNYKTLYVEYKNVEGLAVSAPVTINGLVVGKINGLKINNDSGNVIVEMQINTDFPISKSSIAEIYASSLIGSQQLSIIPNLEDKSVVADGDFLKPSNKLGLTDELGKQLEPLKDKIEKLLDNANTMLEGVNQILDAKSKENLRNTLATLDQTMSQFHVASQQLNSILSDNKSKIGNAVTNLDKTVTNFNKISTDLDKANIGSLVQNLQKTLDNVNGIMGSIDSGKGTMGKLVKDEALYTNLAKTSKELELLLQDLRLNPTRYVNVSLFGKKNKPYVGPTNDTIK